MASAGSVRTCRAALGPVGGTAIDAGNQDDGIRNMTDDPELEFSPLCGSVTRDGVSVRVEIYRLAERDEGWSLEVIDEDDASTVWDDTFATDHEAYAEFARTLELEGIRSFRERPTGRPN
jgi:hypothetical protein